MSRPYTEDEIRDTLIINIIDQIGYWDTVDQRPCREKLEGLAFSILATLDGESGDLPAFKVVANPHHEDKEYHELRRENYYPDHLPACEVDISGCLHERFHPILKEMMED